MAWVQRSSTKRKELKYWLHTGTGETRWTRPHDSRAVTPQLRPRPATASLGWSKRESRQHPGLHYFHNRRSGETRWEPPVDVDAAQLPTVSLLKERLRGALRARALGRGPSSGKALMRKVLGAYAREGEAGALTPEGFVRALQGPLNLGMVREQDLRTLYDFYAGPDGLLSIGELLDATLIDDYTNTRGIIDFPSGECGAANKNVRGRPDQLMMQIRKDLRLKFKEGKGLFKSLREMFDSVDVDGSGVIDREEFKAALRGPLPLGGAHEQALGLLFEQCDRDGSGHISFQEFEREMMLVKPASGIPKASPQRLPLGQVKRVFVDTVRRACQRKQCRGEVFDRMSFRRKFTARGMDGCDFQAFRRACAAPDIALADSVHLLDLEALFKHYQPQGDLGGVLPTRTLLAAVTPSDIEDGRGILDYPSDDPAGGAPPSDANMALVAIRREVQKQAHAVLHDRYEELFSAADTDGSGEISMAEFKRAFRGPYGRGTGHERALEKLFWMADTNQSGKISFCEFKHVLTRPVDNPDLTEGMPRIDIKRLRVIFRDKINEYSKQRGRWVAVSNPDTIRRFFHEMCPAPSTFKGKKQAAMSFGVFKSICHHRLNINNVNDSDLRALFDMFDKDKSGEIDCDEFLRETFPQDYVHEKGEMLWDEEKNARCPSEGVTVLGIPT
eukprot:g291.t1